MKKLLSIFAVVALATFACFTLNSCEKNEIGDYLIDVEYDGNVSMNVNIINSRLDDAFVANGFQSVGSCWIKSGNFKDLKKEAIKVFEETLTKMESEESIFDNSGIIVNLKHQDETIATHTMKK